MKIYIVQHGDAVPKTLDPVRPLSDLGRKEVKSWLVAWMVRPVLV